MYHTSMQHLRVENVQNYSIEQTLSMVDQW
jgi:hypothetical protein